MLKQFFWMFVLMIGMIGITDSINRDDSGSGFGAFAPAGPSIESRDGTKCCDTGPPPSCEEPPCGG